MERLTRFVLAHRRWVFAVWLVAVVAGGAAAGQLTDKLSYDFSLPGQEGWDTEAAMLKAYGQDSYPTYIPVYDAADGSPMSQHRDDLATVAKAVEQIPGLRVVDYAGTHDKGFLTRDGATAYSLVYGPPVNGFSDPLADTFQQTVEKAASASGLKVEVTGYQQLAVGSEDSGGPSVLAETLIGAGLAFVVLLFVFASALALIPMVIAAVAIMSTFLVVLGLTTITDVSFVVQFLIALVGLGVAIDYSLLVVSRWREERAHGVPNDQAVVTAMKTAGHAVLASGITVAISLLALVAVPVPMLRSMGIGGMLIPAISVIVVLTLLPAMLGAIGPRMDWPRIRHEGRPSPAWAAWARAIIRGRWVATGVAAIALAVLIAPVFGIQIGQAGSDSLAKNGPAYQALHRLEDGGVGSGVLTPIEVLIKGGDPAAVVRAAQGVDGVRAAVAWPAAPDGTVDVTVMPDTETNDNTSVTVVKNVRDAVSGQPGLVGVTGAGATVLDYQNAVYKNFPYVLALIAFVTFVLLMRTFRSVLLPLKAVLLNLVSLSALFGLVTWFWQEGHGSDQLFDTSATGALTFWVPVMIFAFLFGLSMDYEVFILARMREEYDRTGSTRIAVEQGLARTGRLVTSAALILFFAFAALASAPGTDIKVLATALGAGILLDATIVRALLVPALVSLFGSWNWWLPGWLAGILRVEPSPRHPEPVRVEPPAEERVPVP